MSPKNIIRIAVAIVVLILVWVLSPFTIVNAGERGVVLSWGAVTGKVLAEGLHWRTPIVQKIVKVDVAIQKEEVTASAATKDLQTVTSKVALNYHVGESTVVDVYRQFRSDFKTKFIDPALQEAVKATTAKYTAEELITKREAVRDDIKNLINEKLSQHGIVVDEFNIVDFDFSAQFNAAIEAKVTAEQSALAAKNKLDQVKYEAEQRVAQATAEAEAIRIQAQAIQQQGGENYVNLKAIEKWDGKLPQQFVPGSALPFITLK